MLKLKPMTEEEFIAFKTWEIEEYANGISNNIRLNIDEARVSSAKQIDDVFRQGLSTPNQYLYNIILLAENMENRIGYLWIDADDQKKRCLISQIYLYEQFRGKGWGRKTLELLEINMKERGINRIGLHVFAKNEIARELYTKMGYQLTGLNMQKWLID